ncbi:MAG: cyclic nucleotide-binding domain-containing protein [Myxococcales bacterium]
MNVADTPAVVVNRPLASVEDLLAAVPLFRNLKVDAGLRTLVSCLSYRDIAAGDVVIRQADLADGVFFLLAGHVRVEVDGTPVANLGPGQSFGEMGLFGEAPRSAEVIALEPVLCAYLDRSGLEQAVLKIPRLGMNLMRALTERIRALNGMLLSLRLAPPQMSPAASNFDDALSLLSAVPIFAAVTDERFLRRVAGFLQPVDAAAGDRLFTQGDAGDRLYLVVEGNLRVHLDDLELARLGPGSHVGEMALLDGEPRSAAVTAETACRFLTLTQAQFFAAIAQAPAVVKGIHATLSERIRQINSLVARASSNPPPAGQATEGSLRPLGHFFPETTSASLWQRDVTTGRWHLPLPQAIAEDYARIADVEAATPADGFAEALRTDAAALREALLERHASRPAPAQGPEGAVNTPDFDRLLVMTAALMGSLRSPLSPRRSHAALANALYDNVLEGKRPIDLRMVLASPTALTELPDFLAVARLVRDAGFAVTLHLLAVRWENWVDVSGEPPETRQATFRSCLDGLRGAADAAGFPQAVVMPVDVEAAAALESIVAPPDFAAMFQRVAQATTNLAEADAGLVRNLLWISGFYGRQRSLQRLGPVQPPMDLAIRMAVGQRASSMPATGFALLLTSELNQRFLECYRAELPIANIALGPRPGVPGGTSSA